MFKYILAALGGALATFAVVTMLSKKKNASVSQIGNKVFDALKTKEAMAMVLTPQGREFVQTPEFKDILKQLAREKAQAIVNLIG